MACEVSPAGRWYDRYWRRRSGSAHRARSLRRAQLAHTLLASGGVRSGKVLDVGCGVGAASEYFARKGFDVLGIDVSPKAVRRTGQRGVHAQLCDIEREDPPPGPFDAVLLLEVLEHLADPRACLQKLTQCLSPEGFFVISLPNEFNLLFRLRVLCGGEPFGGHDDPHLRHFGYRSARRLVAEAGLRARCFCAVGLLPPRYRGLSHLSDRLGRVFPALCALSFLFLATPAHRRRNGRS